MPAQMTSPSKWKSAVDPRTGRVYFYDPVTRETRWERPSASAAKEAEERREFFAAMEARVRAKLAGGAESALADDEGDIVGVASERDPAFDFPSLVAATAAAEAAAAAEEQDEPAAVGRRVRTLSSMDDTVLPSAKEAQEAAVRRDSLVDAAKTLSRAGSRQGSRRPTETTIPEEAAEGAESAESKEPEPETKDVFAVSPSTVRQQRRLSDPAAFRGNRPRANTTNSMHVSTTMSVPDREATIQVVCSVLRAYMLEAQQQGAASASPDFDVFRELSSRPAGPASVPETGALSAEAGAAPVDDAVVPPQEALAAFMRDVFMKSQMEAECLVMSLVYVERLLKATDGRLQLQPSNWRPIVLATLIMASKVWDDLSMWNVDFSMVCPTFTLQRINELERALLEALHYNVRVSSSQYAKYYFNLRSWSAKIRMRGAVDHSPLDLDGARRLEAMSQEYQDRVSAEGEVRRRRFNTMHDGATDEELEKMHSEGYQYAAAGAKATAALEQVVNN